MWLWSEKTYFSFDDGGRVEAFHSFQDETQFLPLAESLAKRAVDEVQRIRSHFRTVDAVARHLVAKTPKGFWHQFHTAVACGLSGYKPDAERYFGEVMGTSATQDWEREAVSLAREYNTLKEDVSAFRQRITEIVLGARDALKLAKISEVRFDAKD